MSLKQDQVVTLRISFKVGQPAETRKDFHPPDRFIDEFFLAIKDFRTYLPAHDTAWEEHQWLLEVYTTEAGKVIPIHFYIPYQRGDIVVADMLGNDGYFQSQQLFQWYQKYSHRWLKPEGAQPTPTPQPETPVDE